MISHTFYDKLKKKIGTDQEILAKKVMQETVEKEKEIAISKGEVDKNGVPLLTVIADGCWSHRSYGTKYSSLSGAAAIVGPYTKKVLWIGHRRKYCAVCKGNSDVPEHDCNINFHGSSTAMEGSILLEGFRE